MSTKAYEAYKYIGKPSDLVPTLLAYKKRFLKRMTYCMSKITLSDKDGIVDHKQWTALSDGYKEASASLERHLLDFDAGVVLHQSTSRKTIVIRPYYEPMNNPTSTSMIFLRKENLLKEFGYWDNADRPEHMSAKEWAARAKVYDSIDDGLTVSWLSFNNFHQVMPLFAGATHLKRSNEYCEIVKEFDNAIY